MGTTSSEGASSPEQASPVTPTLSPGGGFLLEGTGTATVFTPEMLSDEQRMMHETADDFVKREVEPRLAEIESKKPGVMREILQKAGEIGLLGHDIPVANPERIRNTQLRWPISAIVSAPPRTATIAQANISTTVVRIAVATLESMSRIPIFAKIAVNEANSAESNANVIQDILSC